MRLRLLASFVPFVAWWSRACAAEPDVSLFKATLPAPPAHLVVEANSVQNQYLMILDTGSTYSWFEKQRPEVFLRSLGDDFASVGSVRYLPIETYQGLPMTLRGVTLKNDPIIQYDLTPLSRKIGRKLDGVLGMDDLRSAKLLFDYETRTMGIHRGPWRLTGRDCREEAIDEMLGLPMLRARLANHPRSLLIDSGSPGCLTLQSSLFGILVSEGVIDELQSGQALGFGGEYTSRRGRFRRGALMGKDLAGAAVDTADGFSGASGAIGLGWMSGFIMEIALSDGKLRYRRIPGAEPPLDLEIMLGASLTYWAGLPSIDRTRSGGGALTEAGLLPTDTIDKLGELEAGGLDVASVTEFVGKHAGSEFPIRFKRKADGKVVQTTVRLPPRADLWHRSDKDQRAAPTPRKAASPGSMSRDKTSTGTR